MNLQLYENKETKDKGVMLELLPKEEYFTSSDLSKIVTYFLTQKRLGTEIYKIYVCVEDGSGNEFIEEERGSKND